MALDRAGSSADQTGNAGLEDEVVVWQARRLYGILPLLCAAILVNTLAMAVAVLGDLPWWQQLLPPLIIGSTTLAVLGWRLCSKPTRDPAQARRQLTAACLTAACLGTVNGLWGVNAFTETETYYCMVAPVFLGLGALVAASCLLPAPRAALAAMGGAMGPMVLKMALYPNLGIRAMAAMAAGLTVMQAWIVLANFRQTRRNIELQRELRIQARTDPLTGLANRRAFAERIDALLTGGEPLGLIALDLNGFKAANDLYGHHVGDAVLIEVADRLRAAVPQAAIIARLGGDEFCILLDRCRSWADLMPLCEGIVASIDQPFEFPEGIITISSAIGAALAPAEGDDAAALLALADRRLYADKQQRAAPIEPSAPARVA